MKTIKCATPDVLRLTEPDGQKPPSTQEATASMSTPKLTVRTLGRARAELRWFFRWAAADVGFCAQRYGGGRGGGSVEADRTTQAQLTAAAKERRIRAGLARLEPVTIDHLRRAFVGHRRDHAILATLEDVAELVYADPVTRQEWTKSEDRTMRAALASGNMKRRRRSFNEWLAEACQKGTPAIDRLADRHRAELNESVAEYARVRIPSKHEVAEEAELAADVRRARSAAGALGADQRWGRRQAEVDALFGEVES